ncbi:hypothetical protein [Aeromonas veronii]|uniref:hypothetical protein n=1 Tax=Aeromonas veronii TaxID=654 RepID=UPI000E1F8E4F|nr:hypothetical protein [Aeromonas veronii]RDU78606.1 hypothetical protein CHF44_19165 [Aeromonas veronii]RDU89427.1 hypothetical protein CHH34_19705 [Aeromonas veronii]TEY60231.1 hypothetical protein CIG15_19225 [Aeromonas veronii]
MTNNMTTHSDNTQSHRPKKFLETVRLIRRQQDILEQRGDAISLSVFDKLESIMQGTRGIKFTAQERGRQEMAFIMAKHQLKAEDAEANWERFETCTHLTSTYQKETTE